ncbi:hypothetical protein ACNFCJ_17655 [Pseudomonas sp. NY15364]|uniref:hypothetical protein n=1 Tax=Pseudomonas sp. NY15364 TaxID=3400353 RepID=UPI003A8BD7CE
MSTEVKRYAFRLSQLSEVLGGRLEVVEYSGDGLPYVLATDYDALHAEAEALRAENGRLREDHDKAWRHAGVNAENVAALSSQLEAARGLLVADLQKLLPELDDALEDLELHGCHDQQGYRKLKDWFRKVEIQTRKLDSALTTTHAPEEQAEQGERQEAVAWIVPDFGFLFPTEDAAQRYLRNINDLRKPTALYATPQPGQDVRALLSADDVRDACANAVSVFAEEVNADQCREVAEYMREVLLAQIARRQAQRQ